MARNPLFYLQCKYTDGINCSLATEKDNRQLNVDLIGNIITLWRSSFAASQEIFPDASNWQTIQLRLHKNYTQSLINLWHLASPIYADYYVSLSRFLLDFHHSETSRVILYAFDLDEMIISSDFQQYTTLQAIYYTTCSKVLTQKTLFWVSFNQKSMEFVWNRNILNSLMLNLRPWSCLRNLSIFECQHVFTPPFRQTL